MKNIFLLVLTFALPSFCYAQWHQVNSGTTEAIRSLLFTDSLIGFGIAGQSIIKTTDGGENWSVLSATDTSFRNFFAITNSEDSVFCFGVNDSGAYYKESIPLDGGANPTVSAIDISPSQIIYFNNDFWYITGANLMRYNEGNPLIMLANVEYFNVINGFISAVTGTDLFLSSDHGLTWNSYNYYSGLSSGPYQSYFDGGDTLVAVSHYPSKLCYSFDQGASWGFKFITNPEMYFYFINVNNIIGFNKFPQGLTRGVIYHSTNFGESFDTNIVSHPVKGYYSYLGKMDFVFGDSGVIYKNVQGWGETQTKIKESSSLKKKLKIFPNPAKNALRLQYSELHIQSLKLMDLSGRVIKTFPAGSKMLDVSGVAAGLYFLQVEAEEGKMAEKVEIR